MADPRTTFRSALWNHAGKILEYMLMYLTSVLIARGLGVQENGVFVGLFSVSQFLLVFMSFGLEVSLNKHVPQLEGEARMERLRFILRGALAIRVTAVLVLAAVLYGSTLLFEGLLPHTLSSFLWVLLAYTGVRSIVSLLSVVLTAELQTRATAAINVLTRGVEVAVIGLMVSGGMTTSRVFVVILSTATFQLACYIVAARTRLFGKTERIVVLPIILFGGVYWINTAVEYFLGRQGDVLFLTMLLPDSSQASLYDVAFSIGQWASLSMTVGLGSITLATFAKLALRGIEPVERFYAFMIRIKSLLSIPLYAFTLFNAGSVLFVLYSPRYLAASGLVQAIAAFRIFSRLFGGPENAEFLLSRGQVTKLVAIGAVGALVNVGLDLLLIPRLGALGAVMGSGLGNLMANVLGGAAVYRTSAARIQWQFWLKVSMATSAASLVVAALTPPLTVLLILMQAAVYVLLVIGLLFFVKPLTTMDYEWLVRIDNRFASPLRLFVRQDPMILDPKRP